MDSIHVNDIHFDFDKSKKIAEIIGNLYDTNVKSIASAQYFLNEKKASIRTENSIEKIFHIEIDQEYFTNLNHFEKAIEKKPIIKFQLDDKDEIHRLDELKYDNKPITIDCTRIGNNKVSIPSEKNLQYSLLLSQSYKIIAFSNEEIHKLLMNDNLTSININLEKEI